MGGQLLTQVLENQLTLSQPEGADCAPHPHTQYYLPTQLLVASYASADYIDVNYYSALYRSWFALSILDFVGLLHQRHF